MLKIVFYVLVALWLIGQLFIGILSTSLAPSIPSPIVWDRFTLVVLLVGLCYVLSLFIPWLKARLR